jgi:hypothetical protein
VVLPVVLYLVVFLLLLHLIDRLAMRPPAAEAPDAERPPGLG